MGSKRKHRQYMPSPPRHEVFNHEIGKHSILPPDHPVSERLDEAGLAFQKEFFRFEDLAAPGSGGLYGN